MRGRQCNRGTRAPGPRTRGVTRRERAGCRGSPTPSPANGPTRDQRWVQAPVPSCWQRQVGQPVIAHGPVLSQIALQVPPAQLRVIVPVLRLVAVQPPAPQSKAQSPPAQEKAQPDPEQLWVHPPLQRQSAPVAQVLGLPLFPQPRPSSPHSHNADQRIERVTLSGPCAPWPGVWLLAGG